MGSAIDLQEEKFVLTKEIQEGLLLKMKLTCGKCLLKGGGPAASDTLSRGESWREGTEAGGSGEKTIKQVKLQQQGVHCGNLRCQGKEWWARCWTKELVKLTSTVLLSGREF